MKIEAGERLFRIAKFLMILTGTWQLDTRISEKWRTYFKLYKYFFFSVYLYGNISICIRCFEVLFVQKNIDLGFELLSYFILNFMSISKTCLCQTRKMMKLIQDGIKQSNMEASADCSTMRIYLNYVKISNFLPLFLFCYNTTVCFFYSIKVFSNVTTFRREHEHGRQPEYLLGFWYPFNSTKYFSYCITIENTVLPFFACYNSACHALFIAIITLCVAQMKVLQYNFQNFYCYGLVRGKATSHQEALANLKKCVRKHQNIISYIRSINESWKYILLLEYMISSVMFAGALLQISRSNDQLYSIYYFVYLVIQLTAMCCIAEELRIQSMKIGDAIYQSKWYEYNKEVKQIMFIVMMRSRKPLTLTIGPFGPLTADVIVTRLKLAYSYMSLIERRT